MGRSRSGIFHVARIITNSFIKKNRSEIFVSLDRPYTITYARQLAFLLAINSFQYGRTKYASALTELINQLLNSYVQGTDLHDY